MERSQLTGPAVITLEKGMALEFDVFIMPRGSYAVKYALGIVARRGDGEIITKNVGLEFGTEVTSVLHNNEVVFDKLVGAGSFGVVYMGTFLDNTIEIKGMK